MKATIYIFFLGLISSLFFSCEKDATIELPDQEPKLSVSCFISPGDSIVSVYVYLSQPSTGVINTGTSTVSDANVVLSDGATSLTIPFDANLQYYQKALGTFQIRNNTTYFLTVTDASGRHVTAQTTVPSPALPSLNISQTSFVNNNNNYNISLIEYHLNCTFTDIASEKNYYRLIPMSVKYDTSMIDTSFLMAGKSAFVNDMNDDGKELLANLFCFESPTDTLILYKMHRVVFVKGTKEYYNFNFSLETQSMSGGGGNPFIEPTIIYSNIEGGYGCFGAYIMMYKDVPY